jgi:hypothetical protein
MPAELQDRTQRHPAQARASLARAQHPRRRRPQRRGGAGTKGPAPRIRAGAVDGMGSPLSPMRCAGNRRARPSRVRGRSFGHGVAPLPAQALSRRTHSLALTRSRTLSHAHARACARLHAQVREVLDALLAKLSRFDALRTHAMFALPVDATAVRGCGLSLLDIGRCCFCSTATTTTCRN